MPTSHLPALGDREFRYLQKMMAEASGIRMSEGKRPLVAGRLMRRLRALGLRDYAQYLDLLRAPEQQVERRLVVDLLTTNETYFFREPQHFRFLAQWLERRRGPLRCWSAACSSGEEPYSLAMVLAEHASSDWSILASDLSQSVLRKAREAVYPMTDTDDFPPGWLKRHCLRGVGAQDGNFRISQALRERVSFREINLMRPLPQDLEPMDLILLRNVLIYFTADDKRAITARLLQHLRPGGLLLIGHAESVHGFGLPLRGLAPSVFERL
ncbi:protein-glutamate O-methyltransferase CheR [Pseudomonas stutzeri]|nr:protein-glutamate O-methyltransferase CheR [Stutzerimonas stutzeri]